MVFGDKSSLDHVLYRNPHISPIFKEGADCIYGYARNIIYTDSYHTNRTFSEQTPWPRFITRMFRQFHAEVMMYAPKDRTLFNYNVKVSWTPTVPKIPLFFQDGWPKLRDYLGIESSDTEFPHENKNANALQFLEALFDDTQYKKQYVKEVDAYLNQFGLQVTPIKKE